MALEWEDILRRLKSNPPGTNTLLPPCNEGRLREVQSELGKLPNELIDMRRHFNGANLFKKTGPLISVFGISTIPPLPPLEWADEWTIDKFTPRWRAGGGRSSK
jgi:hypothetical protein